VVVGSSVARPEFTVLVVEDNDRIRKSEADALASCGYDVLTATDASAALQLLPQSPIDLVITDVRLPGRLDGIAFSRAVKEHWPEIKVMIVGADVDQFSSEDLHPIVDDVLKKPFKLSELEGRVAKLLDQKRAPN
jgi:DNA-binding response OmpR family regulator